MIQSSAANKYPRGGTAKVWLKGTRGLHQIGCLEGASHPATLRE